eukprot:TRINITY_DN5878_c0_g1_i1.p1 TRINITY_DN5878_c0_g1~~TRINITY_DN5878_c0_g1_i1.p1  ORF type:complete len:455 (-),score=134.20 TRINITY_DN5878_c0_g1_i1:263-1627(-)
MAKQMRVRPRSSLALRVAAGGVLLVAVRHFGPSFTIKGSWDGSLADLKTFPEGLEPSSIGGIAFSQDDVEMSLDNGLLALKYSNGPLSLAVDDWSQWAANFTQDNTELRVTGVGGGSIDWEASKTGSVAGLGDIEVDVSSQGELEVGLTPATQDVGGFAVQARTKSSSDGIAGQLEASRSLNDIDLKYALENEAGEYNLANMKHVLNLGAKVGGGDAEAFYTYDADGHNYNATFSREIAGTDALVMYKDGDSGRSYNVSLNKDLGEVVGSDSDLDVGVDDDGVYGALSVSKELGEVGARMDVSGRVGVDGNPTYAEALTLSHKLGSLKVSADDEGSVDFAGDFEFEQDSNKLNAAVGYSLGDDEPTYNVTVARDLTDLVHSEAGVQLGIDQDGVYGSLSASKDLGNDIALEYGTAGRKDSLTHRVQVSNNLGFAELSKAKDDDPRVRVGYAFDM